MESVQCYCTNCKVEDTRQEMGNKQYDRFVKLFEMWKRLNWLYNGKSLGARIKYVYSNENHELYTKVKAKGGDTRGLLKELNVLRNEYEELRYVYNDAKYYRATYDTVSVDLPFTANYDFDNDYVDLESKLVCAHCGNEDVFIISNKGTVKHLGVTKDIISEEIPYERQGLGLYSENSYDYTQDPILNKEIRREYNDITMYNDTVKRHRVESEFYAIASTMSIGQLYKKLGKTKCHLIADVIAEYYSVKMSMSR